MNRGITVLNLLTTALTFAACTKEKEDPTDKGVPTNTLIAGGTSISMASVVCSEFGSGNDLILTASDLAQNNVLYIRDMKTIWVVKQRLEQARVTYAHHRGYKLFEQDSYRGRS